MTIAKHSTVKDKTQGVLPGTAIVYRDVRLEDSGGSVNMDVDGSSTPVNFDFAPSAGEVWYLEAVVILIVDPGGTDWDEFGSLGSELTNGVDLLIKTHGTEYTVGNHKNNADLVLCFSENGLIPPGSAAFLDDDDIFRGSKNFRHAIKLDGDLGDYVRMKVQDDLENLEAFRAYVRVWKEVV